MSVEDERPLSGGDAPAPVTHERLATAAVETVLDLDEVMSQARLVEKKARICLRGDLYAEHAELLEELAGLVNEHGELVRDDEDSLASEDTARAEEITDRLKALGVEMREATRVVLFRAMPDDEWRAWNKAQRDSQGEIKDGDRADSELIARTAVEPKMTVEQVEGLRKKLGSTQIGELAHAALMACTTGGVDVPKSPGFSRFQRRDSSGRN